MDVALVTRVYPTTTYFSLVNEAERIASCTASTDTNWVSMRGEPYIMSVDVSDKHQNKGFCQRLLREVIDYYKRAGAQRIALEVNKLNDNAVHVYEKMGFEFITSVRGPLSAHSYYMILYL